MFLGFGTDIEHSFQAIFEAQENHRQSLEEKQEEDMRQWMETKWEERMLEQDSVALVVNVQSARMAGEKAVVEIRKWWYIVSVGFLLSQYLELTLFSRSQIGNG